MYGEYEIINLREIKFNKMEGVKKKDIIYNDIFDIKQFIPSCDDNKDELDFYDENEKFNSDHGGNIFPYYREQKITILFEITPRIFIFTFLLLVVYIMPR